MTQRTGGTAYIDNICFNSGTCVVQPSRVSFTELPASCIQVGAPFTVEVCATDNNGFVAETYSGNLTISSAGTVSGTGTMTATQGCSTFTLTSGTAETFNLSASASSLTSGSQNLTSFALCSTEENLKIISYNLLNFPNGRTPCEASGDIVPPNRQDTLAKIMDYLAPDVLMVCELQTLAGSNAIIQALQTIDPNFQAATFVENQSSSVTNLNNMLYYNSAKMTLIAQDVIETNTRDVSQYRMQMNDPQIASATDTVFIDFYVTHLKAGSAATDRQRRADDIAIFQTFFDSSPLRNAVIGGDMNFYESSEVAYQTMLNSAANPWFDPAMAPGDWDNDASFADLHTQSAREFGSQSYACGITGGIDSRFDFLLLNGPINNQTDFVEYINGSYEIPGNNGNLFNESINDPSNNSGLPFSVLDAMFFMSDHLPVSMDLKVTYPTQVLPVELLTFTAKAMEDKTVALRWTADNAIGFSHYEIERLSDTQPWTPLARVNGGAGDFHFTDDNPADGVNYYRLRMVDFDHTVNYSPIRTVRIARELRVYPTITSSEVWVGNADIEELRLMDSYGRVHKIVADSDGRISLSGQVPGWYIIQARTRHAGWLSSKVILQ